MSQDADAFPEAAEAVTTASFRRLLEVRTPGEWIKLDGIHISGVVFEVLSGAEELDRIDFSGSTLTGCSFKDAYLRNVKFQGAALVECDFRYAEIERTSFKRARLTGCDLYRARLGTGAVFENAKIIDCSLNLTTFDGVSIPRDALVGEAPGLLQEHLEAFRAFHSEDHSRHTGEDEEKVAVHLARRHQEASDIYRALSAHWASAGRTRDAGWAYYHGRRLETAALRPDRVLIRRAAEERATGFEVGPPAVAVAALRWLMGSTARWVAGFGESPFRVAMTTLLVVLVFAVGFGVWGPAANESTGWWSSMTDSVLFSSQAMTASLDLGDHPARWVEWASEIETALGITLLGLLGFCLGNRLRSA